MKVKGKKMRTVGNDEVVKRIIPGETDAKIDLAGDSGEECK